MADLVIRGNKNSMISLYIEERQELSDLFGKNRLDLMLVCVGGRGGVKRTQLPLSTWRLYSLQIPSSLYANISKKRIAQEATRGKLHSFGLPSNPQSENYTCMTISKVHFSCLLFNCSDIGGLQARYFLSYRPVVG